ncbi:50S ribosomal protein L11 methyltransferase [Fructobacillus ficulneus]|uniref:Ribosomal protein L11 methyltransferase n=1 Tax=Fructobacillus ficulneus TaxID=157463 RepID=A0A0K8MIQ9_9LACO|nr:50S ribosomal protein L11 methyltransferase [Fructobacillus ficulneus]GAP00441.1 ribosomal protein L11 methyltransferase [Fructobacillus ficulneus]
MEVYQKIVWQVPVEAQDIAVATLVELGADGVELGLNANNQPTVTIYENQIEGWENKIQTYTIGMGILAEQGLEINPAPIVQERLESSSWENEWKNYYHAARVTNHFTVVPAWEDYQKAQNQELLIVMDPDQAFGTGTHPTTALMLQALEAVVRGGEKTIDVGTGSGVLAVAAKHLGVGDLLATDIDEAAVVTAQANLDLNPVAKDVEVIASDLMADVDPTWSDSDLIMANILADVITPLIPQVYPLLKSGGYFLVSGIYDDVKADVAQALSDQGLTIIQELNQGTWHAFISQKPVDNLAI